MVKYISSALLIVVCISGAFAQNRGNEKQSPKTAPTKPVTRFRYDFAGDFNDGLAKVVINNKVGFIDKTGKEVIPVKYDDAVMTDAKFTDGLIRLKLGDNYGMVDKNGTVAIPFQYGLMDKLSEGLVQVYMKNKGTGFIDKKGKEVIPLKYDINAILFGVQFKDGLGLLKLKDKYGYADKTGKELIPLKYDAARNFSEGLAVVGIGNYPKYKQGYINTKGEEVIALQYDRATDMKDGVALVLTGATGYSYGEPSGGKWGLIDKRGKILVTPSYDNALLTTTGIYKFSNGRYPNEKSTYFDKTGKEIPEPKGEFSEGVAMVYDANLKKSALVSEAGKEITRYIYDYSSYSKCSEGLIPVSLDKKFGYIDKTGKTRITSQFDYAGAFKNGYATVGNNNLYGIIDKTGKVIIPLQYQWVGQYSDGWCQVKQNDKYGFINLEGKFIGE